MINSIDLRLKESLFIYQWYELHSKSSETFSGEIFINFKLVKKTLISFKVRSSDFNTLVVAIHEGLMEVIKSEGIQDACHSLLHFQSHNEQGLDCRAVQGVFWCPSTTTLLSTTYFSFCSSLSNLGTNFAQNFVHVHIFRNNSLYSCCTNFKLYAYCPFLNQLWCLGCLSPSDISHRLSPTLLVHLVPVKNRCLHILCQWKTDAQLIQVNP